ncbi:hypothetical protein [Helicobacter sp. 23-1046]
MVEEITQSQNIVPFEVGKKPNTKSQDSNFSNFLKETQNEFSAKESNIKGAQESTSKEHTSKEIHAKNADKKEEASKSTLAKGDESKGTKNAKGEELEQKGVKKTTQKANAKDDGDEVVIEDSLSSHKLASAKNVNQNMATSVLSQALNQQKDASQSPAQKANEDTKDTASKDSKDLGATKGNLANTQSPKTLQDVRNLAQLNGLNPTKVEALQDEASTPIVQSKAKESSEDVIPESAKYKVQYKLDNGEYVAVIHRGTQKPQNITTKISSIYESIKTEESMPTLSSLFGLKDLP